MAHSISPVLCSAISQSSESTDKGCRSGKED
uniref:Uncharacterized protein MANES_07G140200 n=1 Tax=Rhizophora mucronata TaxID=61149 RepID=A0A2P2MG31_RHIMU